MLFVIIGEFEHEVINKHGRFHQLSQEVVSVSVEAIVDEY